MKTFVVAALITSFSVTVQAAQDAGSPRLNFLLHCAGCHKQDASGKPESGIPSFRNRLGNFLKIDGGREFIAQVPGSSQSPLSDAETAELLNWILKTFSPQEVPKGTAPFTTGEVGALRQSRMVDVPGRREALTNRLYQEHGVDMRGYR